ncbi:MAG TPA: hypothetical protein VFZ90_08765 [Gemmatimonadales bacterium]|jgi:hypothetical protein|nr:hypothetical protein [Gemmatimonadales bacterium]
MFAEPPQNGGYMLAAYIVTPVILGGYWVRLWRRNANLKRREREEQLPKR